MDIKAMYKLSYGLFVLTAREADKDNGCIINTAIQAALSPNQLSICVSKANYTHDIIKKTGEFTVSVLSQNAGFDLFKHFGFQSGRELNKFENFSKCKRGDLLKFEVDPNDLIEEVLVDPCMKRRDYEQLVCRTKFAVPELHFEKIRRSSLFDWPVIR